MTRSTIEALRQGARRRLPRLVFDYIEGGSGAEQALAANLQAMSRVALAPRLADVSRRTLGTRILGEDIALPLVLSPVALGGLAWADGERLAARAAARAGVPYTVATLSNAPLAHIARDCPRPPWFQLFVFKDRGLSERLMDDALSLGCRVLVLTIDMPLLADHHRGLGHDVRPDPATALKLAWGLGRHPGWWWRHLRSRRFALGNLDGPLSAPDGIASLASWLDDQLDPSLGWSDLGWVRARWPGALVVKGVLDADSARQAAEHGADAVVVSNHGGRQLDAARATIAALPEVVAAVGERLEVHLDGGIRSGLDILRALALGADAVHIGRPYLYGLADAGEAGVERCLAILRRELDQGLAMCGCSNIREVDAHALAANANHVDR